MEKESLIAVSEFCTIHHIEFSFVNSLNEYGLIEIIEVDDTRFIPETQLLMLEKIVTLHDELGINLEGIDTINHLLNIINDMQSELTALKNRLRFYEDFE
ncbi:MAG: chaperone modulator CbpM [Bacteroidia bacterium]